MGPCLGHDISFHKGLADCWEISRVTRNKAVHVHHRAMRSLMRPIQPISTANVGHALIGWAVTVRSAQLGQMGAANNGVRDTTALALETTGESLRTFVPHENARGRFCKALAHVRLDLPVEGAQFYLDEKAAKSPCRDDRSLPVHGGARACGLVHGLRCLLRCMSHGRSQGPSWS